jgi:hypothetical protein
VQCHLDLLLVLQKKKKKKKKKKTPGFEFFDVVEGMMDLFVCRRIL